MLGLRFCVRAFSSCGERGPLFIAVHGSLTVMASLVVEHRLQKCRLSSCGSRAQLLRGMWDLPKPGLEPVSPALAGRFSTTVLPGKPQECFYYESALNFVKCFFCIDWDDHVIFLLYSLNVVFYIDCMWKHPCISGINTTWSWCAIILICGWFCFANILLRNLHQCL